MRVLWITNILFPEAEQILKGYGDLHSSGGWLLGCANELCKRDNLVLAVAAVSPLVNQLERFEGERILYYVIPLGNGNLKYNKEYEKYWMQIKEDFCPDVVHIHGTEFTHGLAYVNACGNHNVVVAIQGLMGECYKYYSYGLTTLQILRNITVKDIIRGSIFSDKRQFKRRAALEADLLRKTKYVIGRTTWDKVHTWAINPEVKYFSCNEILREEFYDGNWQYDKCDKFSIFISQAGYPLKGFHQLIKALPIVLKYYPNTMVYVAGRDITRNKGIKDLIHYDGYGHIINKMIKNNHISAHIQFVGSMNAEQMKARYLKSNVFISLSSIENSPNSLGEAQMLGVPCISSNVGGVIDMIPNEHCGLLYRYEDTELLAWRICDVFINSPQYDNRIMVEEASKRHDRETNISRMLSIYSSIIEG